MLALRWSYSWCFVSHCETLVLGDWEGTHPPSPSESLKHQGEILIKTLHGHAISHQQILGVYSSLSPSLKNLHLNDAPGGQPERNWSSIGWVVIKHQQAKREAKSENESYISY